MVDTFTCAKCGETFENIWSDSEAEAQYDKVFAEEKAAGEERDVVCDDCYNIIMNQ